MISTALSLDVPSDLLAANRVQLRAILNGIVASSIALWMKTKSFHWHVVGPRFSQLHELFDDQASQIYDSIDPLAERVRKLGGATIRNLLEAQKLSAVDADYLEGSSEDEMLAALLEDNQIVVKSLRAAAEKAESLRDCATANLLQGFLDDAEKRVWFLAATKS